jgi:vacuolar-type H+-ATPase subunit H
MEGINDIVVSQVTDKAIELVESKVEEFEKKAEETVDEVLDTVQENTQKVADDIEDAVEKAAQPLKDLIDNDPRVKAMLDSVTDAVGDQFDGREFSCGCFGWMFALRIARKSPQQSQSTSKVIDGKLSELPDPREEVGEMLPPKTPSESQSMDPVK